MVPSLVEAGVDFVTVDDTHFRLAGIDDHGLHGYYITEDGGKPLRVFPIDKTLRYTIPFRDIHETVDYLARAASGNGGVTLVHADDGEKFGVWPKTYAHVYESGWLESLCKAMAETPWLRSAHFGEVIDDEEPRGRIYLPSASYQEMMKWALPPDAGIRLHAFEKELKLREDAALVSAFVRGADWRNFFARYPEANHLHKKMLRVADRVHRAPKTRAEVGQAREELWAAQCNDAYWHGVFGGLYLPNLRYPLYHHLLRAESLLDTRIPAVKTEQTDFDADGNAEVVVESPHLNLYFSPRWGGSLLELDYKPAALNLLDILSRREEAYHRRARIGDLEENLRGKEAGLLEHLHVDWYRHASLIDHFFDGGADLRAVSQCAYRELGDFVNQPYRATLTGDKSAAEIVLERNGALWTRGVPHHLTVRKVVRYAVRGEAYDVEYTVTNTEERPIDLRFGIEWNVGLQAGDAPDRFYTIEGEKPEDPRLRSMGESPAVRTVALTDEWLRVRTTLRWDVPATLWRFPLETVSLSEGGLERVYQSSVVLPVWNVRLEPRGGSFRVAASQQMERLG
jgi:alpha-amylase